MLVGIQPVILTQLLFHKGASTSRHVFPWIHKGRLFYILLSALGITPERCHHTDPEWVELRWAQSNLDQFLLVVPSHWVDVRTADSVMCHCKVHNASGNVITLSWFSKRKAILNMRKYSCTVYYSMCSYSPFKWSYHCIRVLRNQSYADQWQSLVFWSRHWLELVFIPGNFTTMTLWCVQWKRKPNRYRRRRPHHTLLRFEWLSAREAAAAARLLRWWGKVGISSGSHAAQKSMETQLIKKHQKATTNSWSQRITLT